MIKKSPTSFQEAIRFFSLERLSNVSDAVFAVVLTLLIGSIRLPTPPTYEGWSNFMHFIGSIGHDVTAAIIAFGIGVRWWISHHNFFSCLTRIDGVTVILNFMFLCLVMLLNYTLAVLIAYPTNFYVELLFALNLTLAASTLIILWEYAGNTHLIDLKKDIIALQHSFSVMTLYTLLGMAIVSILIAITLPGMSIYLWIFYPLLHYYHKKVTSYFHEKGVANFKKFTVER